MLAHCSTLEEIPVMKNLGQLFLAGLATLLPVLITLWVVLWLIISAETWLGGLLQLLLPELLYFPGMGVAAAFGLVLLVGLLARNLLLRKLFSFGEALLQGIPLVKTIYGAIRDFMTLFAGDNRDRFSRVVMVRPFPDSDVELLGFVTREDFSVVPVGIGDEDRIAVYMPMSYQIGGYTLFLPRDRVRMVDMSLEDAMRFAVTAGVSVKKT
jgi:uncharacterized membrane protein